MLLLNNLRSNPTFLVALRSKLVPQRSCDFVEQFTDLRPVFELCPIHQPGFGFVLFKHFNLCGGECGVVNIQVASSFRRKERSSKLIEPTETHTLSTIITLQ